MRPILFSPVLIAMALTSACTWKDAYGVAQGSRRFECVHITDMQDRQRCMDATSMSYDRYEGERQRLRP